MPKIKTKSAAKKRFKITGTVNVLYAQAGKCHGMIKRTNKQIRNHRGTLRSTVRSLLLSLTLRTKEEHRIHLGLGRRRSLLLMLLVLDLEKPRIEKLHRGHQLLRRKRDELALGQVCPRDCLPTEALLGIAARLVVVGTGATTHGVGCHQRGSPEEGPGKP